MKEIDKSQSVYLNITQALLADISSATETMHWFTPSSAKLTFRKVVKRYEKEGISFLTKTLPRFGKALDKALSGRHAFVCEGFRKIPNTKLPMFMGELTARVFESDGWLKANPCISSIVNLRLLTSLYKKLELNYEKEDEQRVLADFKSAEDEFGSPPREYVVCPDQKSGEEERDLEPTSVSDLATCSCLASQRNCLAKGNHCGGRSGRECCAKSATSPNRCLSRWGYQRILLGLSGRVGVRGCQELCVRSPEWRRGRIDGHHGYASLSSILWMDRLVSPGSREHYVTHRHQVGDDGSPGESGQESGGSEYAGNQTGNSKAQSLCNPGAGASTSSDPGYWDLPVALHIDGFKLPYRRDCLVDLMSKLIARVTTGLSFEDITPSHGPGAVATGEKPWEKKHFKRFYKNLHAYFPYDQFFYWSPSHLCDELDHLMGLREEDPIARICLVPKDYRGPRVISCEPLELMWIQQGMMRVLYKHIETHPLTKGCVLFTNQQVNNSLAREGSIGGLATLDLKEASDRVALTLVRRVFPEPLIGFLEAARSVATRLPNGEVLQLRKFAPMGSSLCFPVMALTIWAAITAALLLKYEMVRPRRNTSTKYRLRGPEGLVGRVFVYGDDVIVPEQDAPDAIMALQAVGLKVNFEKSFISGQFKESCGGYYFNGHDVSGIQIRTLYSSTWSAETYASYIDYSNQFYKRGYRNVAGVIARRLESDYGYIPRWDNDRGKPPCPALIHYDGNDSCESRLRRRWNKDLQRFEVRVVVVGVKKHQSRKVGWCDLLETAMSLKQSSWPSIRTRKVKGFTIRELEVDTTSKPIRTDINPIDMDPSKDNRSNSWRWWSIRRYSKLYATWMSGEGLS